MRIDNGLHKSYTGCEVSAVENQILDGNILPVDARYSILLHFKQPSKKTRTIELTCTKKKSILRFSKLLLAFILMIRLN